jgi:putative transposase
LLLSVLVHSADIVDHVGGLMLLWRMGLQGSWPRLEVIYADGGYTGPNVSAACEQLGCRVEIVSPAAGTKGFKVLPKRWVVERTFGWLGRCRQLSKEYDVLTECSEGWVYWAMTRLMLRRLERFPNKLSEDH